VWASDPAALPSQTQSWVDAMCATGSYAQASLLFRRPSGQRLILPLVRRAGLPARVAPRYSLPDRWGSGGLIVEDGRRDRDHARDVMSLLAQRSTGPLVLVPNPRLNHRWSGAASWSYTSPKWNYELDLTRGFDEVWRHRFRGSVRRAVRKAEKSDVVVERDTTGRLMPTFLTLYEKSVLRWAEESGVPTWLARRRAARLESLAKFEYVARAFGDACVTWMAFVQGLPAAGIVVLTKGHHADYWRGAMDLALAGPARANDLLHSLAIEEACSRGVSRYSFGISDPGSGLARFKEGFGATAVGYSGYVFERFPVRRATRASRRAVRRLVVAAESARRR